VTILLPWQACWVPVRCAPVERIPHVFPGLALHRLVLCSPGLVNSLVRTCNAMAILRNVAFRQLRKQRDRPVNAIRIKDFLTRIG
jgi:hypothetical protein